MNQSIGSNSEDSKWCDIPGYEGIYQISNAGVVKSLRRLSPQDRILPERLRYGTPTTRGVPYILINLRQDGVNKMASIHRLVAQAFVPNPEGKPQVGHLDNDPSNNNHWNLEWQTAKENIDQRTEDQFRKDYAKLAKD